MFSRDTPCVEVPLRSASTRELARMAASSFDTPAAVARSATSETRALGFMAVISKRHGPFERVVGAERLGFFDVGLAAAGVDLAGHHLQEGREVAVFTALQL